MRLLLVNPNTSVITTGAMVGIAREEAAGHAVIDGLTAPSGAPLITDEAALDEAGRAVASLSPAILADNPDGVIVSAFGDPGLDALRAVLPMPVTGIAEAGMAEAGQGGRRFCVVTTTPDLKTAIERTARHYGHAESFAGVWLTPGDPAALMNDPARLVEALRDACLQAIREADVAAIVIGGGPLAVAARALKDRIGVPLIEPVPCAMRLALKRAEQHRKPPTDLPETSP
jgi:Asp/Glu/hydantoin racemase